MSEYTYNYPVIYVPETNESITNIELIKAINCVAADETELSGLWNNNLCTQDQPYCQPFVRGDKVYLQFIIPNPTVIGIFPTIVNGIDNEFIWLPDAAVVFETGSDDDGNRYQNCIVDTTYLPEDICCFYIKWFLYYQNVNYEDFSACVADKMGYDGQTQLQAIHNCLEEMLDPAVIKGQVTEPYCEEKCLPTIVVQGEYPKYDCNGNYYAPFTGNGTNSFLKKFRVYGEIAEQGYSFSKTILNGKTKSSKQVTNWLLRTPKIPPYVAKMLADSFNSKQLTINGAEFDKTEEITKNNDDGFMWIVNTTLTTECDEINFTCS